MKLPLAYYGESVLRRKAQPIATIDQTIRELVENMDETMTAHRGCGLAAPQVHRSLALFITCIPRYAGEKKISPGVLRVFINPKIVAYSKETEACEESCLSIPGLKETVIRPLKIVLQAVDLEGKKIEEEFSGFDARVMMHENDHLNGVLYIDRLSPARKKAIEKALREIKY